MNNNIIRICILHPQVSSVDWMFDFLKIPNEKYHFVWDDKNPDYIIASEWVYYESEFFNKFLSLQKPNVINIFFAGECLEPDLNIFDYAIVFDKNLKYEDRVSRIPTLQFFDRYINDSFFETVEAPKELLKQKKYFCNFIYSNGNAHPNRDKLFYKISEYKKVDSLGPHLRNVEVKEPLVHWSEKKRYKFSIACENACYKGYTSEKIITSFAANTIPIYWGDPLVENFFNPKAFINANNKSFDEVLKIVQEIDNNDQLWCKIIAEPHILDWQKENFIKEKEEFQQFLYNIFDQEIEQAKRVGQGYHPTNYRKWFRTLTTKDVYGNYECIIKKNNFLQNVFSVRNSFEANQKRKIISLFGIKFKFKTSKV